MTTRNPMIFDPALGIFRKAGEGDEMLSKGGYLLGNDVSDLVTITSSGTILTASGALTLQGSLTAGGTNANITFGTSSGTIGVTGDTNLLQLAVGQITIDGSTTIGGSGSSMLFSTTSGSIGVSGNTTIIQLDATTGATISGTYYGDGSNLTGVVSDHGALSGLTDDDHTQYALLTGVRAFTGDVTISGGLTATDDATIGGTNANITFGVTSGTIGVSDDTNLIQLATGQVTIDGSTTIGGSGSAMLFSTTSGSIGVSGNTDIIQLDVTTGATISGTYYGDGSNLTGVVSDHGALTGLSDDDHTQYALLTGVRAFTGDVTISGGLTATGEAVVGGTGHSIQFATTSGSIGVSNDTDLIQLDGTIGITINNDLFFGANTISGTGDIYAGNFYGDGSNLTGVGGSSTFLNLTDTMGSFNANRVLFESGAAVVDSSDFTFDSATSHLTLTDNAAADQPIFEMISNDTTSYGGAGTRTIYRHQMAGAGGLNIMQAEFWGKDDAANDHLYQKWYYQASSCVNGEESGYFEVTLSRLGNQETVVAFDMDSGASPDPYVWWNWNQVDMDFFWDTAAGTSMTLAGDTGNLTLLNGTGINEFSTDGTLSGNSDDAAPTEKAVKTYVDAVTASGWTGSIPTISGTISVVDGIITNYS